MFVGSWSLGRGQCTQCTMQGKWPLSFYIIGALKNTATKLCNYSWQIANSPSRNDNVSPTILPGTEECPIRSMSYTTHCFIWCKPRLLFGQIKTFQKNTVKQTEGLISKTNRQHTLKIPPLLSSCKPLLPLWFTTHTDWQVKHFNKFKD